MEAKTHLGISFGKMDMIYMSLIVFINKNENMLAQIQASKNLPSTTKFEDDFAIMTKEVAELKESLESKTSKGKNGRVNT
ncbi:MAG TPA: hypothetical protein VLE21_03090 [Candidatus Nitrosocosmicus sp.]|nr:hypothetical protein [Candidatus Nitrosocosmicus sp.]